MNGHSGSSNGVATSGTGMGDAYANQNGASTSTGAATNGYPQ